MLAMCLLLLFLLFLLLLLLTMLFSCRYACSPVRPAGGTEQVPILKPFDPFVACEQDFPITEYQPIYFVAESMGHVKSQMIRFCESLKRPFHCRYNPLTATIQVDRAVARLPKTSTLHLQVEKQKAYFDRHGQQGQNDAKKAYLGTGGDKGKGGEIEIRMA
jgi:hypothetical protein